MKTQHLIDSLVADRDRRPVRIRSAMLYALPPAALLAVLVFFCFLDIRVDLGGALASWRYLLKLLMSGLVAAAALGVVLHLAQPQNRPARAFRWLPLLALPLLAGFFLEGLLVPAEQWALAAMGRNPLHCLIFVPLLSLAPLAATLWIMARGAPQSPAAGGAAAGLAAGGIGALIYAAHCSNDSPFYVAIWYLGAIALVTAVGAIIGHRWLRW